MKNFILKINRALVAKKKLLSLFLALVASMMVSVSVWAETGKLGPNIIWEYKDGTLTLSGTGDMPEYYELDEYYLPKYPWKSQINNIKTIVVNSGITGLTEDAFREHNNLTTVSLPEGLTTIGQSAFIWCEALKTINIPSTVTSIGAWAFNGCKALTGPLTIPAGVTNIESYTFENCSALTTITLSDGLKTINEAAFKNCTALKEIVIPNSVEAIYSNQEDPTFGYCTALGSVTLSDKLEAIQAATLYRCNALKELIIPAGIKSIGSVAISSSKLEKVTCLATTPPELYDAEEASEASFYKVPGAVLLVPEGKVDDYKASMWNNYFAEIKEVGKDSPGDKKEIDGVTYEWTDTKWTLVQVSDKAPETLVIPEKIDGKPVGGIKAFAFEDNTTVKSVTVPVSITTLPDYSFKGAKKLESVTLPEGLTSIRYNAFGDCKALTTITLPSTLERIYEDAFVGCDALCSVTCLANTPPSFYSEVEFAIFFEEGVCRTLYVPEKSVEAYKNSFWPDEFNHIRPIGYKMPSTQGVTYVLASDHWEVTQISDEAPSTLELLEEIDCRPVTVIAKEAMKDNKSVKNLTIPSSITDIDITAFDNSAMTYLTWNVKKITLKDSKSPFANCAKLYSVVIGPDVEEIPDYFCYQCANLGNLATSFATNLKKVGRYAFSQTGLTDVDFGYCDNVEIGNYAFEKCESLTTVYLEGKYAKSGAIIVGNYAFNMCKELWMLTLADLTLEIGNYAFSQTQIESVIFNNVTTIGKHGFSHIYNGLSIVIKGRVPDIEDDTFRETPIKGVRLDCSIQSSYTSNDNWTTAFASPDVKLLAEELTDDMITILPAETKEAGCGYIIAHKPACEEPYWKLEVLIPEGYTFLGWEGEPCNSQTIMLPASTIKAGRTAATARFEKNDNFAVTVKTASNLGDIGGVNVYSCDGLVERPEGRFDADELAFFLAIGAKGWAEFKAWKHNGKEDDPNVITSGNELSFTVTTGENPTPTEITAVYAYKDIDVTVNLSKNGEGEVKASASPAKLGSKVTLTATPVDGQKFVSWKDRAGNVISTEKEVEITLSHTILRALYKDGETYQDLYKTGDLRPFSDFATDYTFVADYTAVFEELPTYEVTLVAEHGAIKVEETGIDLKAVPEGTTIHLVTEPEEGYEFNTWQNYTPETGLTVTQDTMVTASFKIKTFTVTFVGFKDADLGSQTVNWNEAAVAPEAPEVEGYEFKGWDTDFDHVTEDLTVKAIYTEKSGTGVSEIQGDQVQSTKVLRDGVLFIERNGKVYDVVGREVK